MNKRIIICGPAAAGKDFLKKKFKERGFKLDVSYTTRPPREGEKDGVDYYFKSEDMFNLKIAHDDFYEYIKHGDYYYGTGLFEWNTDDVFIMETFGIKNITPEDRKNCFIIYLNPPLEERIKRLREGRGWTEENIKHRTQMDEEKFKDFNDYDLIITDPNF
jgi:guanylate kinase